MDYPSTTRQDKRDSKKKQSSHSIYSSKHIRAAEELIQKRLASKTQPAFGKPQAAFGKTQSTPSKKSK
jgi:hypothetical protein